MSASLAGHQKVVEQLIGAGANVDAQAKVNYMKLYVEMTYYSNTSLNRVDLVHCI